MRVAKYLHKQNSQLSGDKLKLPLKPKHLQKPKEQLLALRTHLK